MDITYCISECNDKSCFRHVSNRNGVGIYSVACLKDTDYCPYGGTVIERNKSMIRSLDGIYFRVQRDGEWMNLCFSDLTEQEINDVIGERSAEWWKAVAMHLSDVLNGIAEQFGIVGGIE